MGKNKINRVLDLKMQISYNNRRRKMMDALDE